MLFGAMVCLAGGLLALGSTIIAMNKGRPPGQRLSRLSSDHAETNAEDAGVRRRHRRRGAKHRSRKSSVSNPDRGRPNFKSRGLVDDVDTRNEVDSNNCEIDNASRITTTPNPLLKVEELFNSRNPAIVTISTWFGSYVMNIDPDGNCFGTSWLIAAMVWAAQSPSRIEHLISTLQDACRPDQAFGCLDPSCTGYVDDLVAYLNTLAEGWIGHAACDTAYGASLAVDVVTTFMGKNFPGYNIGDDDNEEPLWLRLKWGVAIASRALDVWTSCRHRNDDASVKLRTVRHTTEMDFSSLLQAGVEASKPGAGVLRPGGGVGLLTGLVVDRYWDDRRATDDYTDFLAAVTDTPEGKATTGLVLHQAGLPHFDVLVTPHVGGLFFNEIAASFRLPKPVEDDAAALRILRLRTESQRTSRVEDLQNIVSEDELEEQIAAMKAFEDHDIEKPNTTPAAQDLRRRSAG